MEEKEPEQTSVTSPECLFALSFMKAWGTYLDEKTRDGAVDFEVDTSNLRNKRSYPCSIKGVSYFTPSILFHDAGSKSSFSSFFFFFIFPFVLVFRSFHLLVRSFERSNLRVQSSSSSSSSGGKETTLS